MLTDEKQRLSLGALRFEWRDGGGGTGFSGSVDVMVGIRIWELGDGDGNGRVG